MPRGRPKKVKEVENIEETKVQGSQAEEAVVQEVDIKQETKEREFNPLDHLNKPPMSIEQKIAQSRNALNEPLGIGQKYFESPEGFIVVGEADRDHVWCRDANNGKGCWINPRR